MRRIMLIAVMGGAERSTWSYALKLCSNICMSERTSSSASTTVSLCIYILRLVFLSVHLEEDGNLGAEVRIDLCKSARQ